jgi:leucyl/phenylalanyl-tRNA--protein transferase
MSNRKISLVDDPLWSLTWYMGGYYPLYDLLGRFYWERLPERAFLPINAEVARRAAAMAKRSEKKFRLVKNQHFDACIRHLQNPSVKEHSWVRAEIVRIYEALRSRGLLMTLEALNARGELAGGLVAIILPGVLIAETMFALEPDASKVCLCKLVGELHRRGFLMMDVQTRHDRDAWGDVIKASADRSPHPCVRLGEQVAPVEQFMPVFSKILAAGGFDGANSWLAAASVVAQAQKSQNTKPSAAYDLLETASRKTDVQNAIRWLRINMDDRFSAALDAGD